MSSIFEARHFLDISKDSMPEHWAIKRNLDFICSNSLEVLPHILCSHSCLLWWSHLQPAANTLPAQFLQEEPQTPGVMGSCWARLHPPPSRLRPGNLFSLNPLPFFQVVTVCIYVCMSSPVDRIHFHLPPASTSDNLEPPMRSLYCEPPV